MLDRAVLIPLYPALLSMPIAMAADFVRQLYDKDKLLSPDEWFRRNSAT